jgi:hypothetical protein
MLQSVYNYIFSQNTSDDTLSHLDHLDFENGEVLVDELRSKYDEISLHYLAFKINTQYGLSLDKNSLKNARLELLIAGNVAMTYPLDLLVELNEVVKVNDMILLKIPNNFTMENIMLKKLKYHAVRLKIEHRCSVNLKNLESPKIINYRVYFSGKKDDFDDDDLLSHETKVQQISKVGSCEGNKLYQKFKLFERGLIKGFFVMGNVNNISNVILSYFMKKEETQIQHELTQHKLHQNLAFYTMWSKEDYESLSYNNDFILDTSDENLIRKNVRVDLENKDDNLYTVFSLNPNIFRCASGMGGFEHYNCYRHDNFIGNKENVSIYISDDDEMYENYNPKTNELLKEVSDVENKLKDTIDKFNELAQKDNKLKENHDWLHLQLDRWGF